jgi:hypothetical protein
MIYNYVYGPAVISSRFLMILPEIAWSAGRCARRQYKKIYKPIPNLYFTSLIDCASFLCKPNIFTGETYGV